MVLEQKINEFLQYLRFEKRYSAHTLIAYQTDLDQFSAFLTETYGPFNFAEITHFQLRSWLAGIKEAGASPRSVNRKMSSLNSFFRYLQKGGFINSNPVKRLHAMRLPDRLPVFLRPQETSYLLEELVFDEGFKGTTDRLICELLYQTGMRRSELLGLREDSIEWSLKQIRVLGKGNKERLLPLGLQLLTSIRHYIQAKTDIADADRDHLLVLESGQPLYAGYIYRVVKKYLSMATTAKKKSPHVLRHTFATHLLNNGAGIQAIKELLGHSSLAATQIYAHNDIDRLKEIHKLNHPRG